MKLVRWLRWRWWTRCTCDPWPSSRFCPRHDGFEPTGDE